MKNKKILTVLLAALIIATSSMSVFAQDNNYSSREREQSSYKNYTRIGKIQSECDGTKDFNKYTTLNLSAALKKASYKAITLSAKQGVPKAEVKDCTDGNNLINSSVSDAIKRAMEKAKEIKPTPTPVTDVNKVLRDQIKAEYEAMKVIEKANKELLMQAIAKQKQVRGFITQVAEGKLTYTDEQLAKIDVLSIELQADVQAVIDKSAAIKAANEAVKAIMKTKDYTAALAKLKLETAARQERGPALTDVNTDLAGILVLLAEGQAVVPVVPETPVTPVI